MVSLIYGPDEFEEFAKEWVPALDTKYVLVERHGGSGDHGIDVGRAPVAPEAGGGLAQLPVQSC